MLEEEEPGAFMELEEEPGGAMLEEEEPGAFMELEDDPGGAMLEEEEPGLKELEDDPGGAMLEEEEPGAFMELEEEPGAFMELEELVGTSSCIEYCFNGSLKSIIPKSEYVFVFPRTTALATVCFVGFTPNNVT